MDKNRPTGREKNVTGGSSNVTKRGQGLGTGPVGNTGAHSNSAPTHLSGGGSGSGGKKAAGGIGVAAIILFILKALLGGGVSSGTAPVDLGAGQAETVISSQATQQADMSVDSRAREKRTVIDATNNTVTIMVYMCGTDLESKSGMATNDLNEMLGAKLSDNVNLLVYTGGCKAWKNNVISSERNQIYQIKDGKFICLEDNMGNDAMVNPDTLTTFIKYCDKNFPANRNQLIFWDHGGGSITGYGYDEKNRNAGSMNLAGIDTALRNAGVSFDFIGFDACLMATVENGFMLDKYADYMIASEETEPGVGWYYTNWLTKLSDNTAMPTVEIGKNIVDDFIDVCNQKCRGQKTTLSVVDLAELTATVPDTLTDFAKSTNDLIKNNQFAKVSKARKNTREFAQSSQIDQIDLIHFCQNIGTTEAGELKEAIEGAVKYNRTATSISDANGLAIYFPLQQKKNPSSALALFNKIGMNSEYSKCIQNFAATQTVGQMAEGGQANPLSSLGGSNVGGGSISAPSGGSADIISQMLGGMLNGGSSSGSAQSYGLDATILDLFIGRDVSDEDTVNYVANNYFDANNLVWNQGVMDFDEEQWDYIQDIELNVFVDDGNGFIDLGMDNVFEFDDNGALIESYDNTWLAIDGQIVPYYHMDTVDYSESYTITGYVPCMLNGTRAELLITFDTANPKGYITGARYVYTDGETDAVAKNMTEVVEGDVIEPICDYYTYSGDYQDSYLMGEAIKLSANPVISNVAIKDGNTKATYRFTDIYNQHYWTPVIE